MLIQNVYYFVDGTVCRFLNQRDYERSLKSKSSQNPRVYANLQNNVQNMYAENTQDTLDTGIVNIISRPTEEQKDYINMNSPHQPNRDSQDTFDVRNTAEESDIQTEPAGNGDSKTRVGHQHRKDYYTNWEIQYKTNPDSMNIDNSRKPHAKENNDEVGNIVTCRHPSIYYENISRNVTLNRGDTSMQSDSSEHI